ncbi:ferredoxin [Amycolatopsis sp. GM8]|uniref:ferredoxin n=1 Tax=Amycolatopsis sp. GM8 TaxID=2896530 RepID=UPI001F1E1965|nr:ferredoxin [Amycolatopsis sp. GM8]
MKITIDEEKCCGAGQCVLVAPELFDQREEDGIVILLDAEPAPDQQDAAREAASMCPAVAIELVE